MKVVRQLLSAVADVFSKESQLRTGKPNGAVRQGERDGSMDLRKLRNRDL